MGVLLACTSVWGCQMLWSWSYRQCEHPAVRAGNWTWSFGKQHRLLQCGVSPACHAIHAVWGETCKHTRVSSFFWGQTAFFTAVRMLFCVFSFIIAAFPEESDSYILILRCGFLTHWTEQAEWILHHFPVLNHSRGFRSDFLQWDRMAFLYHLPWTYNVETLNRETTQDRERF